MIASQKNRLLATVLVMTGCPQATLHSTESRAQLIEVLKICLPSSNTEVDTIFI